jgi:tetratricopeptide (TPR) repeat protein
LRAIKQLGDRNFAVREAATKFLWQCGLAAQSLLEKVAVDGDPEASKRAAAILARFAKRDLGELPPDRSGQLAIYALGARKYPVNAMQKVLKDNPTEDELREFLLAIPSVASRRRAVASMSSSCETLLRLALRNGPDFPESLLRTAAATGDHDAVRRWVAYLVVTNRTKEERNVLEKQLATGKLAPDKRALLSALRYATGDRKEALDLAEEISYDDIKLSVAVSRRDWIRVGDLYAKQPENGSLQTMPGSQPPRNKLSQLAIRSRAARLAGAAGRADQLLDQMLELARKEERGNADYCYNLLLMENRIDDLLRLLEDLDRRDGKLMCLLSLGRSEEAIRYAERPENRQLQLYLPRKGSPAPAKRKAVTEDELDAAFKSLMEKKESTQSDLCEAIRNEELQGFHGLALRHAAQVVDAIRRTDSEDQNKIRDVVYAPFHCGSTAVQLFDAVQATAPERPSHAVLQEVSGFLHADAPLEPVRRLLADGAGSALKPKEMSVGEWYSLLADIAWSRGLDKEATDYLERAAAKTVLPIHTVRQMLPAFPLAKRLRFARLVACKALAQEECPSLEMTVEVLAACEAIDPSPDSPAYLIPFLAADRNGHAAALPMLSYEFKLLGKPGLDTASRLARRWQVPGAAMQGGLCSVLVEEHQFAEALPELDVLELRMAGARGMADWDWEFMPIAVYRQLRIAALLGLGRQEEAKRIVRLAPVWALDADRAIALYRLLAEAGLKDEAEYVFRTSYRVLGGPDEARGFGQSLNNLAWLCAECGQELPNARRWIERVVSARPNEAASQDTLAHVLAAQGELDEAVRTQRRAVRLQPWGGDGDLRLALRQFIEQRARQEPAKRE